MIDCKDIINSDERIVKICETVDKKVQTFYSIWDRNLSYWRGISPLGEHDAWTRDITRRAKFKTRQEAKRELACIHQWREETL